MGLFECAQLVGDQPVGVVPVDGPVVVVTGAQHHRLGEPALLGQPVLGPRIQIGDGVPGEELRGDDALGRFLGDGLGAVLAELGELAAAVFLGPCAAGAVEAVALIEPHQRRRGPPRAHGLEATTQRHHHGRDARRLPLGAGGHRRVLVVVRIEIAGGVASPS